VSLQAAQSGCQLQRCCLLMSSLRSICERPHLGRLCLKVQT
jgi:hypothetical protein